ncbi:hydroxyethylthiazole kinase [Pseudodesulfovibrio sp. JC047]|uniref:hydroxyethylthiazole kinase n=1 Tax=Pseudodesulfovibrio sp. JC047 TaxID=2683199 RepID=UPI0013D62D47|nr:hydroxyethylthiazole kinase [Pseudodesulfovibrio sp. JC047]NDV19101.1 hydroxyethylthiazole kinase [Pseudodesulfovibrio sp. JC047]
MTLLARTWDIVERIRSKAPLVHNITNYVVMNNTANALLALGASPLMAHAQEEMQELAAISNSLVLNIGTLSEPWVSSMLVAGKAAKAASKPIIFDPVGAGASSFRTQTCTKILQEVAPTIIRGNPSEIMAVAGADGQTKGVDSIHTTQAAETAAEYLAEHFDCVVVVSGKRDMVVSTTETVWLQGGTSLMAKVTGMGCTSTAICGACAGVADSAFDAAVAGMALMKTAGGMAAAKADGPGSFQMHFLDALYSLNKEAIRANCTIEG